MKELTGIYVENAIPNKTKYYVEEPFDYGGLVIYAEYDGEIDYTRNVAELMAWETLSLGDESVTGTFTLHGENKTVTINGIRVTKDGWHRSYVICHDNYYDNTSYEGFVTNFDIDYGDTSPLVKIDNITMFICAEIDSNYNYSFKIGKETSGQVTREIYTVDPLKYSVTSLTLSSYARSSSDISINEFKLTVASDSDFTEIIDEVLLSYADNSTLTFYPSNTLTYWPQNSYYKWTFEIENTSSPNNFIRVSSSIRFEGMSGVTANITGPDKVKEDTIWESQGIIDCEDDFVPYPTYTFIPSEGTEIVECNITTGTFIASGMGVVTVKAYSCDEYFINSKDVEITPKNPYIKFADSVSNYETITEEFTVYYYSFDDMTSLKAMSTDTTIATCEIINDDYNGVATIQISYKYNGVTTIIISGDNSEISKTVTVIAKKIITSNLRLNKTSALLTKDKTFSLTATVDFVEVAPVFTFYILDINILQIESSFNTHKYTIKGKDNNDGTASAIFEAKAVSQGKTSVIVSVDNENETCEVEVGKAFKIDFGNDYTSSVTSITTKATMNSYYPDLSTNEITTSGYSRVYGGAGLCLRLGTNVRTGAITFDLGEKYYIKSIKLFVADVSNSNSLGVKNEDGAIESQNIESNNEYLFEDIFKDNTSNWFTIQTNANGIVRFTSLIIEFEYENTSHSTHAFFEESTLTIANGGSGVMKVYCTPSIESSLIFKDSNNYVSIECDFGIEGDGELSLVIKADQNKIGDTTLLCVNSFEGGAVADLLVIHIVESEEYLNSNISLIQSTDTGVECGYAGDYIHIELGECQLIGTGVEWEIDSLDYGYLYPDSITMDDHSFSARLKNEPSSNYLESVQITAIDNGYSRNFESAFFLKFNKINSVYNENGEDIANMNNMHIAQYIVKVLSNTFCQVLSEICVSYGITNSYILEQAWIKQKEHFKKQLNCEECSEEERSHCYSLLRYADSNENGDPLQTMLAKYDWIVAHYGFEDFLATNPNINRAAVSSINISSINTNSTNKSALIVVIGVALLALSPSMLYLFKKRKEH